MIDANLLVRTWLIAPSVFGLDGNLFVNPVLAAMRANISNVNVDPASRIYAGHIPVPFDPVVGPGIVVRVGGGSGTSAAGMSGGGAYAEMPIIKPRVQISVWANVNQYQIARSIYLAIFDWIHGKTSVDFGSLGFVMSCLEEVEGQDITDPKTSMAYIVSFWDFMMRPGS